MLFFFFYGSIEKDGLTTLHITRLPLASRSADASMHLRTLGPFSLLGHPLTPPSYIIGFPRMAKKYPYAGGSSRHRKSIPFGPKWHFLRFPLFHTGNVLEYLWGHVQGVYHVPNASVDPSKAVF